MISTALVTERRWSGLKGTHRIKVRAPLMLCTFTVSLAAHDNNYFPIINILCDELYSYIFVIYSIIRRKKQNTSTF